MDTPVLSPVYSLWLVPSPHSSAHLHLRSLIQSLATTYRTPVFSPHITLLGGIRNLTITEIQSRLERILEMYYEGIPIVIHRLVTKPIYFQSVVLAVDSPTPSLRGLNKTFQQEIHGVVEDYFPHLSLLYGDIPDKSAIIGFIESGSWVGSMAWKTKVGFVGTKVQIVRTSGPVEEWEVVGEFNLEKETLKEKAVL